MDLSFTGQRSPGARRQNRRQRQRKRYGACAGSGPGPRYRCGATRCREPDGGCGRRPNGFDWRGVSAVRSCGTRGNAAAPPGAARPIAAPPIASARHAPARSAAYSNAGRSAANHRAAIRRRATRIFECVGRPQARAFFLPQKSRKAKRGACRGAKRDTERDARGPRECPTAGGVFAEKLAASARHPPARHAQLRQTFAVRRSGTCGPRTLPLQAVIGVFSCRQKMPAYFRHDKLRPSRTALCEPAE